MKEEEEKGEEDYLGKMKTRAFSKDPRIGETAVLCREFCLKCSRWTS